MTYSPEDHEVTPGSKETGKLLGVSLKDHVIVVADTWKSFRSCKLL